MMALYYVNKNAQANGDHEVHRQGCPFMPLEHNRVYVGDYETCRPAVQAAKMIYPTSDGCKICSGACHSR